MLMGLLCLSLSNGYGELTRGDLKLSVSPKAEELRYKRLLPAGYILVGQTPSSDETSKLVDVLLLFRNNKGAAPWQPLEKFLKDHPQSGFRLWIRASIAQEQYRRGFYSEALMSWEGIWSDWSGEANPEIREYVTRCGVDLGTLYARLGRKESLRQLLKDVRGRPPTGPWAGKLAQIRQAYSLMTIRPERSFNCGPYALLNVHRATGELSATAEKTLQEAKAPPRGFNLRQLDDLSSAAGLSYRAVKRTSEKTPLVFPSVVHWKSHHYAAALEERDGRIRIQDPTFKTDFWMDRDAFLAESSGFFLIKCVGDPPTGWVQPDETEANRIHGKGIPAGQSDKDDPCRKGCDESKKMPSYGIDMFNAAAVIVDTPIYLETPYGPEMSFKMTYFQDAKHEPNETVGFSNMGTKWSASWFSFAREDSASSNDIRVYLRDGRRETHTLSSGESNPHRLSRTTLKEVWDNGVLQGYERIGLDGSEMHFLQKENSSATEPRYYLTELVDPQGNSVTLGYVNGPNGGDLLDYVQDAFGRKLVFEYYTDTGKKYLVKRVREKLGGSFKRDAQFTYNSDKELTQVTDMGGIVSSFAYGDGTPHATDFIEKLTTPYGDTKFNNYDFTKTLYEGEQTEATYSFRALEVTDPENLVESVLYAPVLLKTDGTDDIFGQLDEDAPTLKQNLAADENPNLVTGQSRRESDVIRGTVLHEGLTLYWDKKANKHHPPDLSDGANDDGTNFEFAAVTVWAKYYDVETHPIIETTRTTETNRVFSTYSTGNPTYTPPTSAQPSSAVHVVQDETGSDAIREFNYTYTAGGLPEVVCDPAGRVVKYVYDAATGLDLEEILLGEYDDDPWQRTPFLQIRFLSSTTTPEGRVGCRRRSRTLPGSTPISSTTLSDRLPRSPTP